MTRKKRSRSPCRCSKCGGRKTFNMNPVDYDEHPMCPCGGLYKLDKYRKEKELKIGRCSCTGYPWSIENGKHKLGSPKCYYKLDGTVKEEPPN